MTGGSQILIDASAHSPGSVVLIRAAQVPGKSRQPRPQNGRRLSAHTIRGTSDAYRDRQPSRRDGDDAASRSPDGAPDRCASQRGRWRSRRVVCFKSAQSPHMPPLSSRKYRQQLVRMNRSCPLWTLRIPLPRSGPYPGVGAGGKARAKGMPPSCARARSVPAIPEATSPQSSPAATGATARTAPIRIAGFPKANGYSPA